MWRTWSAIAIALFGCGGGNDDSAVVDATAVTIDSAPGIDAPPGTPDAMPAPLMGRVLLAETSNRGSSFAEFFQDGFPSWQTETMSIGACTLREAAPAFCSVPCAGVCIANDTCVPFPTRLSAGDIVFTGLAANLTLEARAAGRYSSVPFPTPAELFSAGSTITATAAGDQVPAFTVTTAGVDDLSSNVPTGMITLADDADFVFTWTTTDNPGERVRLHIDVPAAAHGLPIAAIVVCDVPESDGTLTLPKEIIAALPEMDGSEDACGNIDCGQRVLERYTSASVTTSAGRVELTASGRQPLFITH